MKQYLDLFSDLRRILDYAEAHYGDGLSVADVAGKIGYSPCHCSVLFKSCYGETLGNYLIRLRMTEARRLLAAGTPAAQVAARLSYTSRGFRKAFRTYYGTSPAQFQKDGKTQERYVKQYEYRYSEENWGSGANPTPDGLWEYGYYDPRIGQYFLQSWDAEHEQFRAPCPPYPEGYMEPNWYSRNRQKGYGMHPGRVVQTVKTFRCPCGGAVDVFVSVGRIERLKKTYTPCFAQLYHNDQPLNAPAVLSTLDAAFLTAKLTVRAGDRIRLHIDPMGNHKRDGVVLYRHWIGYRTVSETESEPENPAES